jgi:choline-sulfatase
MRCIKRGDWKLIKYNEMDSEVRETVLFNLADNPNELIEQNHNAAVI